MRVDHQLSDKEYARSLRKNLTKEEKIIWGLLRGRKFLGYKFLRQHPIKIWNTTGNAHTYFADFYCAEKRLVLEIDGPIHEQQTDYDQGRDFVMKEIGLKVLRITNQEVNEALTGVLNKIKQHLQK